MEESLPSPDAEVNIFDQFDVQVTGELLPGGASIVGGYFCRLPPCCGQERLFKTKRSLTMHRSRTHFLENKGTYKIPEEDQIRQWLLSGQPRLYEIPQRSPERTTGTPRPSLLSNLLHCKSDTESELQPASLESNIYEQFDVRQEPGEAGDSPYVGFFCLLSQCHEEKVCLNTYAKWITHRRSVHKETKEVQCVNLPGGYEIRDWVTLNKPRPYEVPVRGRARKKVTLCPVDSAAKTSTELHNREVNPTPSNVGNEELHKLLSLEGRSSLRRIKSLARLEKFRPSTPPDEIRRESRSRGRRPSNADAAGCSSDTEPAHHQKKKRHTIHSTNRSQSTDSTDSDSSDLVVLPVVARGEDPNGGLRKQFMEKTNPTRDETPASNDSAEESDDGTEDVDDLSVDRTVKDPNHDHNSADIEEFGEEPREDSTRPEDALPPLPYSQPESHDSGAADVAEVDEDAYKEFEAPDNIIPSQPDVQNVKAVGYSSVQPRDFQGVADEQQKNSNMTKAGEEASEEFETPDNVLPPQPELQNFKVLGHSSVQPQDFQGVTDEHQRNSNAEMVDADAESPKDSVAPDNVLPPLQNSSKGAAKMGEVEEEPEDFVAVENALTALTYSQPKLWEHSSVQPQEFQGGDLEALPNSKMSEVEEQALEVSVAVENVLSSLSCLQPEFSVTGIVEHGNVLPQEFQGEIHVVLPNTQMTEFGEAHEEFIKPWNLNPSVQSDVLEQIALSPLWHLDGDALQCLPQGFPGENWPNSSKEDNLNYSAEMAEFGEKAPEEIVAVGNLSLSVKSESSEQNALPTLKHYFRDVVQFSPEDSPKETDNHRPISNAEMAEVGEEAPQGFVTPGNIVPWVPLTQSEATNLPSLEDPIHNQAALALIQESVPIPRVHMDPVFINGASAAGMSEVGEETLEEFAAPGNLMPFLPSYAPQETGEQLYVSRLNTNASSQDLRIIQNEPTTYDYPWTTEFINTDIASMNEPAVVVPLAPSTQPEGRETGSIFMVQGSAENSRENEVDPFQELTTLIDLAVALSPKPMQQLFISGNSEVSYKFPAVPALQTDPDIHMNAGLECELRMRLQSDEIRAWLLD